MVGRTPLAVLTLVVAGNLSAQQSGAGSSPSSGVTEDLPEPGNVLILLADDLGVDMVGAYRVGTDAPPTPNIDLLAREGVLFRNAWSEPVCSPTRAAIQTGRYGFRTTIGQMIFARDLGALPFREVTLPEMLDRFTNGLYAHAAIGKWHLTNEITGPLGPNLAGYSHYAGSIEGAVESYYDWTKTADGVVSRCTNYTTSENVDDALDWIRRQDRPWLCYLAFQAPHVPYHRPPSQLHTQSLPAGEPRESCFDPTGNDQRPYYKAAIEALDTEIGRLLRGIEHLRDETTVIFLADNGPEGCVAPPAFTQRAKGTLYETGIHVPFIVAGPLVERPGSECRALVNASDVFATAADVAGVSLDAALGPWRVDSHSVVPYLRDPDRRSVRRWAYAEYFSPNGHRPAPLPPCPSRTVCQQDIGFDGPGSCVLSICGEPLYGAFGVNSVPVTVTGAPANRPGVLRIGPFAPAFDPAIGAWLVSPTPSASVPFTTSAAGTFSGAYWTSATSHELHYQVVIADPAQPLGFTVSSALRIDPLWTYQQAARNERFKLSRFNPCDEELYDMLADPTEQTDLLLGPLTGAQLAAYDELSALLDSLR